MDKYCVLSEVGIIPLVLNKIDVNFLAFNIRNRREILLILQYSGKIKTGLTVNVRLAICELNTKNGKFP